MKFRKLVALSIRFLQLATRDAEFPPGREGEELLSLRHLPLTTPYNVGSVLWRLFSTLEVVQYIGRITSVLWGDSSSTVEVVQYSGGITSVHVGG